MKSVKISPWDFNSFLWFAVAGSSAKDEVELEVALRLIRKLKAISKEVEEDSAPGTIRGRVFAGDSPVEVVFEEDEWALLRDRVISVIPKVSLAAAEEFSEFLNRVKSA